MNYKEWAATLFPFEAKTLTRKEIFQAGAASRDAEIAENNANYSALAHLAANYLVERKQLREQVAVLREALLTCSVGDFSTGHVMYPSFDEKLVEEALAATEPKITKPT